MRPNDLTRSLKTARPIAYSVAMGNVCAILNIENFERCEGLIGITRVSSSATIRPRGLSIGRYHHLCSVPWFPHGHLRLLLNDWVRHLLQLGQLHPHILGMRAVRKLSQEFLK